MEWSSDVEVADWWVNRLRPFWDHVVGSTVPAGFEAVTRLFHTIENEEEETLHEWSEVAADNGRIAHAEMQLHRIVSRPGENRHFQDVPWVNLGHLPTAQRRALANLLLDAGAEGPIWFGFSDINGGFHCDANRNLPKAGPPEREYFLIRAALAAIDEVTLFASSATEDWQASSPNLWWPEDQTWFVVTEIDFAWTYIAGPESLIAAIESSPLLEALRSDYTHEGHADADKLNPP